MTLLAIAPALPLHKAGPYVAAAYIVFVALILIYVAIMAYRLTRTQRDLAQLRRDALDRRAEAEPERDEETVAAGRLTRAPEVASPDGERGPA